jgi:hypothetical protein
MPGGWSKPSWNPPGRWHKWSIGLKVTGVVIPNIHLIREDWGAGYHFHANGDVFRVLFPKSGIIIVIVWHDKCNSDNVQERHASHTTGSTQNGLNLVKRLGGIGGV